MLQHTQRAIITREFAGWTGPVELNATDPTDVVVGHVPAPGCDGIPLFDGDLHGAEGYSQWGLKRRVRTGSSVCVCVCRCVVEVWNST